ncbi:MAG: hypothetical protein M3Y62_07860 [Candidatus Dormibacteraeota bacterium]|nr:hypothetical protein [Candidatus Dormibacteraeota bacterium]
MEAQAAIAPDIKLSADELCRRYTKRVFRLAAMVSATAVDSADFTQGALEKAEHSRH